ncbi:MAG: NADH-quinone oxidoreductase subunit NuoH [Acidobacteriota bacterium]
MPPVLLTEPYFTALKLLMVLPVLLSTVPVMTWLERRGSAFMQDRLGPNRIRVFGIQNFGLVQPLADAIKFIFKEDVIPAAANRALYVMAPGLALVPAITMFAAIPFAAPVTVDGVRHSFAIADINLGVLAVLAIGSLSVYGVVLGGWASNNKFSLVGGLRSSAQMLSYELSMGLAVLAIVMSAGSFRLDDVVGAQGGTFLGAIPRWNLLPQFLGFLVFLTAAYAETNRTPFDIAEADSELVAGYHTEYGSMKFALFFMAEYIHMATASALLASLYLGGWQVPYLDVTRLAPIPAFLASAGAFTLKTLFFLWLYVWVRWTVPRFRYDQLMKLGWKVLLPLSVVNMALVGILITAKVL